eukprot:95082-Rhodomonas_salina.1
MTASGTTVLLPSYELSSTDLAYADTREARKIWGSVVSYLPTRLLCNVRYLQCGRGVLSSVSYAMMLRACYGMRGAEVGYAATRLLRNARYDHTESGGQVTSLRELSRTAHSSLTGWD